MPSLKLFAALFAAVVCQPLVADEQPWPPELRGATNGSTLYVNFNGHAAASQRPSTMKPIGFGLCAFAAIHIPESERTPVK